MDAHQRALLLRLEGQVREYAALRAAGPDAEWDSARFYSIQAHRWDEIEGTLEELEACIP
jgi:hypothetical protein